MKHIWWGIVVYFALLIVGVVYTHSVGQVLVSWLVITLLWLAYCIVVDRRCNPPLRKRNLSTRDEFEEDIATAIRHGVVSPLLRNTFESASIEYDESGYLTLKTDIEYDEH